jgi:hypothetical protein
MTIRPLGVNPPLADDERAFGHVFGFTPAELSSNLLLGQSVRAFADQLRFGEGRSLSDYAPGGGIIASGTNGNNNIPNPKSPLTAAETRFASRVVGLSAQALRDHRKAQFVRGFGDQLLAHYGANKTLDDFKAGDGQTHGGTNNPPVGGHDSGFDAFRAFDGVTSAVGNAIQSVPLIGPIIHTSLDLATRPFSIAEDVLKGQAIDHVLANQFQRAISDIKEEAPFVQTVVSFVPGIGPAVSAAIGAGLAMVEGRPIDEVLMAAVKGAIPGGPLISAAFDMGKAAIQGRIGDVSQLIQVAASAAGVEIPSAAITVLKGAVGAAQAAASGGRPDAALLNAAVEAVAPTARGVINSALSSGNLAGAGDALIKAAQSAAPALTKNATDALTIGMAVAHGARLQKTRSRDLSTPAVQRRIASAAPNDSTVRAARASLHGRGIRGFNLGLGLLAHSGVSAATVRTLRDKLGAADAHGFDVALALHVGRVASPMPPPNEHPAARAAFAIAHGLRGNVEKAASATSGRAFDRMPSNATVASVPAGGDPNRKAAVLRTATNTPAGHAGAVRAAKQIRQANASDEGFFAWLWQSFRTLIGLEDKAKTAFFDAGDKAFGAPKKPSPPRVAR